MRRRDLLRGAPAVLLFFALAGCGRGIPSASFNDAVDITEQTLRDLLLGLPPERSATHTRVDPPLLKAGVHEVVLLAADAEGFARVSQGRFKPDAALHLQERVVEKLDRDLKKRGFSARGVAYGADVRGEEKALLATLTPSTEEAGSPKERAEGKGKTIILIRLTVTDAKTGAILSRQDYYSGLTIPSPKGSG